jgi:hypothetical protein
VMVPSMSGSKRGFLVTATVRCNILCGLLLNIKGSLASKYDGAVTVVKRVSMSPVYVPTSVDFNGTFRYERKVFESEKAR